MEAAKRKTFWLSLIALACVFSTSAIASSVNVLHLKTRAELSAENGQFSVEQQAFYLGKHVENYDGGWGTASDSSVAPNSVGNKFPADPNDLTKQLGVLPSKVSTTQHGTRRMVWEPNKNTRIRYESHPGDSGPFNPRHHGEHYHVEIKPDNLTWNQAKRQGRITKVRPENYQPGHGTGFVPGEGFPGSN